MRPGDVEIEIDLDTTSAFQAMTTAQAEAAKEALSATFEETGDSIDHRFFNLDAAKMLFVLLSFLPSLRPLSDTIKGTFTGQ